MLIWGCDECSISIDTHAIAQRVFKIDSHLLFLRGGCAKAQFLSKDFVFCAAFHWPVLKAAAATLTVRETQSFFFASPPPLLTLTLPRSTSKLNHAVSLCRLHNLLSPLNSFFLLWLRGSLASPLTSLFTSLFTLTFVVVSAPL